MASQPEGRDILGTLATNLLTEQDGLTGAVKRIQQAVNSSLVSSSALCFLVSFFLADSLAFSHSTFSLLSIELELQIMGGLK